MSLDVDDDTWVRQNPVYCPVPWCNAHKLRSSRCGDKDGDYEGIHVARIKAVPRSARTTERRVAAYRAAGVRDPELAVSLQRVLQDAIDAGVARGRKGRR